MANKRLFNIGCPRCDTQIVIRQDEYDYLCTSCHFHIKLVDPKEILTNFQESDIENITFEEKRFSGKTQEGHHNEGLELHLHNISETAKDIPIDEEIESHESHSEFNSKVANTQIIHLSFDPSAYMEEALQKKAPSKKTRISLKKVVRNSAYSRPPKKEVSPSYYLILGAIILAATTVIAILLFQ